MLSSFPKEFLLNTSSKEKWLALSVRRRSGVLAPLFSLYSKNSIGIGELWDLKILVDWARLTGNSIIQLLPMNEVGGVFCPYDSVSSFAIEPSYISLEVIPYAKNKFIADKISDLRKRFTRPVNHADYSIKKEKMSLLWDIFHQWDHSDSLSFKKFKDENLYWIEDFALFKVLKQKNSEAAWYEWEPKYRDRDTKALENLKLEHAKEIYFQMWVQWQLFEQFKFVKRDAASKNILIKGDLPILVSKDSADVWSHREYFKLGFAAGAPPDMYCARGQRWGMPTYNWEKIEKDGFRYLKEKFKYAQNFYDILRIDHVVGLFRIWSIPDSDPEENKGLNGFFDPQDENLWGAQGKKILSVMLNSTQMLLCAEDLGVIPWVCTETLKELGIPGNDVQRWVKDWNLKHDFLSPQDYRALSVAMLSTHDTTNWPAWWENEAGTIDEHLFERKCSGDRSIDFNSVKEKLFDPRRSRYGRLRWMEGVDSVEKLIAILARRREEMGDFIDLYLNSYGEKEKLWERLGLKSLMREDSGQDIVRRALQITLDSNAIFCINTIVDWLYLTDIFKGDSYYYRLNTPGTISDRNWSLVMPISLEELLRHTVNRDIRNMIDASGRI